MSLKTQHQRNSHGSGLPKDPTPHDGRQHHSDGAGSVANHGNVGGNGAVAKKGRKRRNRRRRPYPLMVCFNCLDCIFRATVELMFVL